MKCDFSDQSIDSSNRNVKERFHFISSRCIDLMCLAIAIMNYFSNIVVA